MNALRISEKEIIRKIYGPIKEGDSWADIVKFIKSFRIRWYGHVERMQNQRMSKQIAAATMEGKRKRGRPRKNGRTRLKRT
jgi:hypothetical protein